MQGYNEFMSLFGNVTVADIGILGLAGIFFYKGYKKWTDHLYQKRKADEKRDKDLTDERIPTYIQDIFIRNIIHGHFDGY